MVVPGSHCVNAPSFQAGARVAGEARGGEILVSSLFRELTESAGEFRFGDRREVEQKGLSGAHQVHSVAWAAG